MRWAVVTLTAGAAQLGEKIADGMRELGTGDLYVSERFVSKYTSANALAVQKPFKDFVGKLFVAYDSLVFVMATGIVCRSMAEHIKSKTKDPAVIVCDEAGKYAISLLSGHLGGGNELSKTVANICGGLPIITTASDVTGNIAVDMFSKAIGHRGVSTRFLLPFPQSGR